MLEYASPVWDPHQQYLVDDLERVQKRAARRITRDYRPETSSTLLVQQLGLETLQHRRQSDKVAMLYRAMNGLVDLPTAHLKAAGRTTRGTVQKMIQLRCKKDTYMHSFYPSAVKLWNTIPDAAASAETITAFKAALGDWQ